MKRKVWFKNFELGQVIPIVVIAMFALIAMAALMIDGGMLLSNRRTAQAAADAGALAGAKTICMGEKSSTIVNDVAEEYAFKHLNKEAGDTAIASNNGKEVEVKTEIISPMFFAGIFGTTPPVTADAIANCSPPSLAINTLPIAFFHESPSIERGEKSICKEDGSCELVVYDLYQLLDTLSTTSGDELPLDYIYIVSNNTRICYEQPVGTIICQDQAEASTSKGNRTWIDLYALSEGQPNIQNIITGGLDGPLSVNPPIWVNADTGSIASGYKVIYDLDPLEGYESLGVRLAYVPLYDKYCPINTKSDCADPGDVYMYDLDGNEDFKDNFSAYRLTGFGAFLITCVTDGPKCDGGCVNDKCPGFSQSNPEPTDKNAIEGYFVDGFDPDLFGSDGSESGIFTITLTK